MEAQIQVLHETSKAHRTRNMQVRLAELHGRLDAVERQLRLRAHDRTASIKELRRKLVALEQSYAGPKRRKRDSLGIAS